MSKEALEANFDVLNKKIDQAVDKAFEKYNTSVANQLSLFIGLTIAIVVISMVAILIFLYIMFGKQKKTKGSSPQAPPTSMPSVQYVAVDSSKPGDKTDMSIIEMPPMAPPSHSRKPGHHNEISINDLPVNDETRPRTDTFNAQKSGGGRNKLPPA